MSVVEKIDYGESFIYCGNCGSGWSRSEWTIYEVFDPEDAADLVSRDDMIRHDKNSLWEFFSHITAVTCYECPNECRYLEDWDDITFYDEAVYLCPECRYPQTDPHDAWGCCQQWNRKHDSGDKCADVTTGEEVDGRVKCGCHEDCQYWFCVVPDCHEALYSGQKHRHDGVVMPPPPVTDPYVPSGPYGGQSVTTVVNGLADMARLATEVTDCDICGTYCCAVHKTHAAKHQFCWA